MTPRSVMTVAVATIVLTACSRDEAPAAASGTPAATGTSGVSQQSADVLAPITEYRLTEDRMNRFFAVQENIAAKMASMSPAERQRAVANQGGDDSQNAQTVDDLARQFDNFPAYRDAIRDADLSTREYATLSLALMQAGMASAVARMRPADDQDSLAREMQVNPANIRFIQEHEAEINRRSAELSRRMKAAGGEQ